MSDKKQRTTYTVSVSALDDFLVADTTKISRCEE